MENDQQNTIKLLNVKSTPNKKDQAQPVHESAIEMLQKKADKDKEIRKLKDEELKSMIEAKMNLLENSGVTPAQVQKKSNENKQENILEAKLEKIFKNPELDNKEKIA